MSKRQAMSGAINRQRTKWSIEAANGGFVLTGLADLPRADKRELLEGNPLEALLTYPKTWGFPFGAELVGRWVKNWEQSAD